MVKLRGPMMSLAASGSLGKKLTFGKALGRPYARRLVIPGNPKTGGQISIRQMIKFLSQQWAGQSSVAQQSWQALADSNKIAPYHAYCKINAARWRSFLSPSIISTILPWTPSSNVATWTAVAGVREITLTMSTDGSASTDWGFMLFASTSTGFTPAYSNLITLVQSNATTDVTFVHGPLPAGTYYYRTKIFNTFAASGTLAAEINATIT